MHCRLRARASWYARGSASGTGRGNTSCVQHGARSIHGSGSDPGAMIGWLPICMQPGPKLAMARWRRRVLSGASQAGRWNESGWVLNGGQPPEQQGQPASCRHGRECCECVGQRHVDEGGGWGVCPLTAGAAVGDCMNGGLVELLTRGSMVGGQQVNIIRFGCHCDMAVQVATVTGLVWHVTR
jgi:hypothetical protein